MSPTAKEGCVVNPSVYLWSLRPEAGVDIELRITAENVSEARREFRRFLAEHDGSAWAVERVARETMRAPHEFISTSGSRRIFSG